MSRLSLLMKKRKVLYEDYSEIECTMRIQLRKLSGDH